MTHSGKRRKTAAEAIREAEADPAYRDMREREERRQSEQLARTRENEAPLVAALRAVGVKVESVWDLVNTHATYSVAIPVLLEHLQRDYMGEIREGIARALAVPEAAWAWDVLFGAFQQEPAGGRPNVKFALACALSGASSDDVIDRIIALVRDPSVGENRLALLNALGRSRLPRARQTLEDMRDDPQLKREIRIILGSRRKRS